MSSTKTIFDQIASTATLASFAIPEVGALVAAGIGINQCLFDLFYPDAPTDPTNTPATQAELSQAVSDLSGKVDDLLWQTSLADLRDSVLAQNDLFMMFWNSLDKVKLGSIVVPESAPGQKDGETYIQDEPDQYLVDELKTYFNLGQPDNVFANMDKAFKVCGHPADKKSKPADLAHRKAENTDLYCLVASTLISFLKARLLWEWGHNIVLKWSRYEAYLKDYNFRTDPTYAKNHPPVPSPLEAGEKAPNPPDWNDWKASGTALDMLGTINAILLDAEGDGSNDYPGLYTTLAHNWYKDLPGNLIDRLSKLSTTWDGKTSFYYVDSDTKAGGKSPEVGNFYIADLQMKAKAGSLLAYWGDYWSQAYAIDNVREEAITGFAQIIDLWKQTRASVSFSVSDPVTKTDTLSSIAKKQYGSDLYSKAIFDFNRPALQKLVKRWTAGAPSSEWERVALDDGMILKLPDQEEVDFFLYTVTADDQYPYTICEKFFHDRNLRTPLDDANSDIDNPTSAGALIRIPALPETPQTAAKFSFYRVKKGDTLAAIATTRYGSALYAVAILDANRRLLKVSDYNTAAVTLRQDTILRLLDQADLGFSLYPVQKTDTLKIVAAAHYGSWLYSLAIYDANKHIHPPVTGVQKGAYWDQVVLTAGDVLTLPNKANVDANDFFVYELAPGDDYPDGIASYFYGDSGLSGFVQNMNADVANPGTGTQIRISVEGLIQH